MSIKVSAVDLKLQLNSNGAHSDDTGTFSSDCAHDTLSTTVNKTTDHDDKIFHQTYISSKKFFDERDDLFSGAPDPPESGNLPENNTCYIMDVHSGATLKGVNQYLDSAPIPTLNKFIASMITHFHTPPASSTSSTNTVPSYKDVTKLEYTDVGNLYMFQLYKSLINKNMITNTIAHRVDYSVYSNYDLLLFINAMKVCGTTINQTFCDNLNIFLNKEDTDDTKNTKIQSNKFNIVNIIALNFLWQNLLIYCQNLMKPEGSNPRPIESLDMLSYICFSSFKDESKTKCQISFPKYKIGYNKPTTISSLQTLDLTNQEKVSNFIDYYSYEIYSNIRSWYVPVPSRPTMMVSGVAAIDETDYVFVTSQTLSASGILKISNYKSITDRGEEKKSKCPVELDNMNKGINALFTHYNALKSAPTPDMKIYFYQLLKFQGDSSHLVMAQLITNFFDEICIKTGFCLDDSFNYAIKTTIPPAVPHQSMINIMILTGERPLTIRCVLEQKNVQVQNFKHLNIYPSFPMIIHISDPCIFLNQKFIQLLKLFDIKMDPVSDVGSSKTYNTTNAVLDDLLTKCHQKNYKNYTTLTFSLTLGNNSAIPPDTELNKELAKSGKSCNMYLYIVKMIPILNSSTSTPDMCKELIKSDYGNKIKFLYGAGQANTTTINTVNNALFMYKNTVSYFYKMQHFIKSMTEFVSNCQPKSYKSLFNVLPQVTYILEVLNQTFSMFDNKGEFLSINGLPTIVYDIKSDMKQIYVQIMGLIKNKDSLIDKLNEILNIFFKQHVTYFLDINYSISTKYTAQKKEFIEPTYFVHHPWSKEGNTQFNEELEEFFVKIFDATEGKDTTNLAKKKEMSSVLSSVISLLYTHDNKEWTKDMKDQYSYYEDIIEISKIIYKIYQISNINPKVKKGPPKDISISHMIDQVQGVINSKNFIESYMNNKKPSGYTNFDIYTVTIAKYKTKTVNVMIMDIFYSIYQKINNQLSKLSLPGDLTSLINRSSYISPGSDAKTTKFNMDQTLISKTFKEDLTKFLDLTLKSEKDNNIHHVSGFIAVCLNEIIEKDTYMDLYGEEIKIINKQRTLIGGNSYKHTSKIKPGTRVKSIKTLKLYGGSITEENKNNFNKTYLSYMSNLNTKLTPDQLNLIYILMDHYNYTFNTINDTLNNPVNFTRNLTRIYFKINNNSMDKSSLLFSFPETQSFINKIYQIYQTKTTKFINLDPAMEKIIDKFVSLFNKRNQITNDQKTQDRIESTDTILKLINLLNDPNYTDKLGYLSLLVSKLTLYDNKNRIKLDHLCYTIWVEYASNPHKNISEYISCKEVQDFFSKVDYNLFMNTTYNDETYTEKTFKPSYIFHNIKSLYATNEDIKNIITLKEYEKKLYEKEENPNKNSEESNEEGSGEGSEEESGEEGSGEEESGEEESDEEGSDEPIEVINKEQINKYKEKIKTQIKFGLIRDYTVVDLILLIIKKHSPIFQDNLDDHEESIFDCYYMLLNPLTNS